MQKNRAYLIISELDEYDGGTIYAKKNLDHFFPGYEVYQIKKKNGILGILNRIYFSRFFNLFFRIPLMVFVKIAFIKILAPLNVENFKNKKSNSSLNYVIAFTEDLLSIEIAERISKETHTKFHLITMDFPWTFKNSSINNSVIKKIFESKLKEIKSAEFVSNQMENIARKKGFDGTSLVSFSAMDLLVDINVTKKNKFNINNFVYTGTPRFKKELKLFYDLFNKENQQNEFKIHVYSGYKFYENIFSHHEFVKDQKELIETISEHDMGLIPMSFNDEDMELVSTSFPGKFSTYIAAGLPILAIAPEYAAISKVIKKYGVGEVLDLNNPEKINKILEEINLIDYSKNIYSFRKEIFKSYDDFKKTINCDKNIQ
tara:strand:+ start:2417 stop:3535 length:1119 start_codon:yes stop_codon:yes gene_type:complete